VAETFLFEIIIEEDAELCLHQGRMHPVACEKGSVRLDNSTENVVQRLPSTAFKSCKILHFPEAC
jgi:hypothetical protein